MPNYRDYQRAMRQGPERMYDMRMEHFGDDGGASYIVPPYELNTGPIDERTQMMIQALEHFGSQSRMPHLDPYIHAPDPEGRLPLEGDLGELNEEGNIDKTYDLLREKRELYPEGDRMRDVYNPGMHPDDAQEMMKQILEEYLARGSR